MQEFDKFQFVEHFAPQNLGRNKQRISTAQNYIRSALIVTKTVGAFFVQKTTEKEKQNEIQEQKPSGNLQQRVAEAQQK